MFRTIMLTLATVAAILTAGCNATTHATPTTPTVTYTLATTPPPTGTGCWIERKTAAEGGNELLQGDFAKMPAGSTVTTCPGGR